MYNNKFNYKRKEMSKTKNKKELTIAEAAQHYQITRQAIYVAIKQGKLKAQKQQAHWTVDVHEIERYRQNRYSREFSRKDGQLLFNKEEGIYSVQQTAQMLQVPVQTIYYAARSGYLKAQRKGATWVIHIADIEQYKQRYLLPHIQKKNLRRELAS